MKPTFFFSFVRRYAPLVIINVLLVALGRIDRVTYFVGPAFYVLELMFLVLLGVLFLRHTFMRRTLDEYAVDPPDGESRLVKEWRLLDPAERVKWTMVFICVFYLGGCLIAAAIVK
jgi:hypothetical protein